MRAVLLPSLLALATTSALAEVHVDGRIDPAEWAGAEHITDFRMTQPLTGEALPYATEAWVLSTPKGLAIAFRNAQPASVPRTRQRTQRDEQVPVDRVNVMVDFDGDGRLAYDLTLTSMDGIQDSVITNENFFKYDWDAIWQHAVSEDDAGWSAEILIPWYTAPMRKAKDGKRTIGLYLDRVIGSTGQRVAWPEASFTRPRFVSDFRKIELPAHSQTLFAVTPYAVGQYNNITGDSHFDAGADLLWKPNGQTQLTATLNPDFGQVESDQLVVNFGAEETFFSDKRPFFTENQSVFDFNLLMDNSQLIYTRRVGSRADDGSGPGDISAAVKLNGSLGSNQYGLLMAEEKGDAGRSFAAFSIDRDFGKQALGLTATHVDRPFLDRTAAVIGFDHRWRPTGKLTVSTNLVGSFIDAAGAGTDDTAATLLVTYQINDRWRQQWIATHFGSEFDINDFGFLARNSMNYAHWQVNRRFNTLPETSSYASHDWGFRIIGTNNDHGLSLQRQFRAQRYSERRDGGNEFMMLQLNAAAHDDLITRGNGAMRRHAGGMLMWERYVPRNGRWAWRYNAWTGTGALHGIEYPGLNLSAEPTYFFNDRLSVFMNFYVEKVPEWTLWRGGNRVASFDETGYQLTGGLNWNIRPGQELRVKLEAIAIDAPLRNVYRVGADHGTTRVNEAVEDFSLRNLGFQVRYRYELAPLSDLYLVYSRGGYALDEMARGAAHQLGDAFELRDDEQFLIKLSYRFDR